jgi:CheY-like chemotaxis protein
MAGRKHILLVEDDPIQVRTFCRKFGTLGVVSVTGSGIAAIEIIRTQCIDLIVLDYHLVDMDGVHVMTWLRNVGLTVPVMTFSSMPERNIEMATFGAVAFTKTQVLSGEADTVLKEMLYARSSCCDLWRKTSLLASTCY